MTKHRHPEHVKLIHGPRVYVCVGPNVWGRGFTAEQAERAALAESMYSPTARAWKFIMYDAPADTVIDEMGRSCWSPSFYAPEFRTPAIELYRYEGGKVIGVAERVRIVSDEGALALAEHTTTAASFDKYGILNWRACAELLAARWFDARQIESLLRSSHMETACHGDAAMALPGVLHQYLTANAITPETVAAEMRAER